MTRFAESIYCDRPVCLWCNNLLTKPSFKILPTRSDAWRDFSNNTGETYGLYGSMIKR